MDATRNYPTATRTGRPFGLSAVLPRLLPCQGTGLVSGGILERDRLMTTTTLIKAWGAVLLALVLAAVLTLCAGAYLVSLGCIYAAVWWACVLGACLLASMVQAGIDALAGSPVR